MTDQQPASGLGSTDEATDEATDNATARATAAEASASVEAQIARVAFADNGLVPAVVQQYDTGEVLMLGYMDAEALRRTLTSGRGTFWSRSRQEYWRKGDTSGHAQYVKDVSLDCDGDTLLVRVDQVGVACHTGTRTCFDGRDLHAVSAERPVASSDSAGSEGTPS